MVNGVIMVKLKSYPPPAQQVPGEGRSPSDGEGCYEGPSRSSSSFDLPIAEGAGVVSQARGAGETGVSFGACRRLNCTTSEGEAF